MYLVDVGKEFEHPSCLLEAGAAGRRKVDLGLTACSQGLVLHEERVRHSSAACSNHWFC
jgi:hypothetical protein